MISVRPTHILQGGASAFLGETWHSGVPPAAPWPGAWLSCLVLEAAVIDPDRHHVTRNRDWDIDLAADVVLSAPANPSWDRGSVPVHGGNDARQGWVAEFDMVDHVAVRGATVLLGS
jgi:hypothetical protein